MTDNDGLPSIAILGGYDKGMELWNPRASTVETIFEEIPGEEGELRGLKGSGMVSVEDDSEIILYGGWQGTYLKAVWKYVVSENSWTR